MGRPRRERERGNESATPPAPPALGAFGRADVAHAVAVSVLFLVLYSLTACPTIFTGDCAELAAAAACFGVPHPPGYPLYTMATGLVVRALFFLEPAHAANLASGLYGAAGLGGLFLVFRRLRAGRAAALVGALCLGLGLTFWSQATAAEVYTFDVLLLALVLHAVFAAAACTESRAWFVLGLAVGLWGGHRTVNVIYTPALFVLLVAAGGGSTLLRRIPACIGGAALSTLVYVYLPLASAADPPIDIGDPETWERFKVVVSGAPYTRHLGSFDFDRVARFMTSLPREVGIAAPLAVLGLVKARRAVGGALALVVLVNLLFIGHYEILDINVYFLPPFAALAALAALGMEHVLARLAGGARQAAAALLVAAAFGGLPWNLAESDLSKNRFTRRAAEDLLASIEEDALLFVSGDTTIHALWYLQGIEGAAPEALVVSTGHTVEWHVDQLRQRYPDEPWPPFTAGGEGHTRRILDATYGSRPIYITNSINPDQLLSTDRHGAGYGGIPRGTAVEVLRNGESLNARDRARWNTELFRGFMERLGPIPHEVDINTKSILLQYALAMFRTAELLVRLKEDELAREVFGYVLRFDPDRHERDVHEDVRRGLGVELPNLRLGQKAAKALE